MLVEDDFQGPRMEQLIHFAVRSFQLKFWFAGCDMFVLYNDDPDQGLGSSAESELFDED